MRRSFASDGKKKKHSSDLQLRFTPKWLLFLHVCIQKVFWHSIILTQAKSCKNKHTTGFTHWREICLRRIIIFKSSRNVTTNIVILVIIILKKKYRFVLAINGKKEWTRREDLQSSNNCKGDETKLKDRRESESCRGKAARKCKGLCTAVQPHAKKIKLKRLRNLLWNY